MSHHRHSYTHLPQYPHEKEILFAPLTGIEVSDVKVDSNFLIVKVRASPAISNTPAPPSSTSHTHLADLVTILCHHPYRKARPEINPHSSTIDIVIGRNKKLITTIEKNVRLEVKQLLLLPPLLPPPPTFAPPHR